MMVMMMMVMMMMMMAMVMVMYICRAQTVPRTDSLRSGELSAAEGRIDTVKFKSPVSVEG